MKKIFRFFLAAMMASALFLGCSTDDNNDYDEDADRQAAALNAFQSKMPGVYAEINANYNDARDDGVARAIKISEADGTYTLEYWTAYTKNDSGKYSIKTETFTKKDMYSYNGGVYYKSFYGNNVDEYNKNHPENPATLCSYTYKEENSVYNYTYTNYIGFIGDDTFVFKNILYKYTRQDNSFDFYAGTDKESSSSSDGSGSSSGSLPSNFDITASSWTYTGTAGSVSITYTVTFKLDGTVTVTKSGSSQASGTWSLSGSTLTLEVKNSSTEAKDKFTLSGSSSSLTLTLSGESSYTTGSSSNKTSDYSMALMVMFMSSSKTATLTSSN